MEVRDNLAVAQLIRASLDKFGLDKPGTVCFDFSSKDHFGPTTINSKIGSLLYSRKMKVSWLVANGFAYCVR